ncbi:MAG TPA: porin [Thermoanaerobaculia bacterium]|nr:porin [Thermoanaerobaculia bacterium]
MKGPQEDKMAFRLVPGSRRVQAAAIAVVALFLAAAAGPADAQAIIKVNENVNVKFGILLQPQALFDEIPAGTTGTNGYAESFFLRRARLLVGGQVAKNVFFFMETDNARLGQKSSATTNLGSGFQLLDAVGEWRIAKEFNILGGLLRVPYSREAMKASGSEFQIDFQAFAYVQASALGFTGGNRDTGFQFRGYALEDHLEWRATATQGFRQSNSKNSFLYTGRVQYNIFDTEVYNMPSYPGSYRGSKKILALGAAYQTQGNYKYASGDVYASIPVPSGAVEGTLQYQYVDGGKLFPTLAQQNIYMVEAGWYGKKSKVGPWARYEKAFYSGAESRNEQRIWGGLGYWLFGTNFNIKAAYQRIMPKVAVDRNQFILQLQFYYF